MKIILSILVLCFLTFNPGFSKCKSVQSGKWSSPETWENGEIPNLNDSVFIQKNHSVTCSENLVESKYLFVQGELIFVTIGKKIFSEQLVLSDSGNIKGSVLGTIECAKIHVLGFNEISGVNIDNSDSIIVKGQLFLKRKSGTKNFKHILISKTGIWQVTDDDSFYINGNFINSGLFVSGSGIYHFNNENTIKGNSTTIFERIQFYGKLYNADSLSIVTSIESINNTELVNLSGATLISKTTPSNFKVDKLNLKAVDNFFVLDRNQSQNLPIPLDSVFYHLVIQNNGTCLLAANTKITGSLSLAKTTTLRLNNFQIKGISAKKISIKDQSTLEIYISSTNDFVDFLNGFEEQIFYNTSKITINSESDVLLPSHFWYPNLNLNGIGEKRKVRFVKKSNSIAGNLFINALIQLDLSNSILELKGAWTGAGEFKSEHSNIIYTGNVSKRIFAGDYDTLSFNNTSLDTSEAFGNFSVNRLELHQGILKIGSLNIQQTLIDVNGKLVVGGVAPVFADSLIVNGNFTIISDFSKCKFHHLLVRSSGFFLNNSSSNIEISGSLHNNGFFKGCLGTGCTWEVQNNVNFYVKENKKINNLKLFLKESFT